MATVRTPKPDWLKIRPPSGPAYNHIKQLARTQGLSTVCEEAKCPNIGECWAAKTATFMLMGDTCTRGCKFCAIKTGNPRGWLDAEEPQKIAQTVLGLGLQYVVLTTVDRDDLPDGGAGHIAQTVRAIKDTVPGILVETLIPDFGGQEAPLNVVLDANPDVLAQNIETVERLTHPVRDPRAGYQQTLTLLKRAKALRPDIYTKSSIMLGLGETDDEVRACMKDLRAHDVDLLTLGQYLQPTQKQLPVERFVSPQAFASWEQEALALGFRYCASGPLVRSSWKAGAFFIQEILQNRRNSPGTNSQPSEALSQ